MQRLGTDMTAVHTAQWNTEGHQPRFRSCHQRCHLRQAACTRDSLLNSSCALHELLAHDTAQQQPRPMGDHASLNKVRNTAMRRRGTWSDFSGALYTDDDCASDCESSKPCGDPKGSTSEADQEDSKIELLDHFWTTDNERLYLLNALSCEEEKKEFTRRQDHGQVNKSLHGGFTKRRRNEVFTEEERQDFENWVWDSYDQMFVSISGTGC
ncbi:hypothetical protein BGZ63DRAFT_388186 [Mariannaea sp. PMI_226]|nr:hypothetical protein BGZ63DRAFT_388186 [Mariannaea sp. PMI_226]